MDLEDVFSSARIATRRKNPVAVPSDIADSCPKLCSWRSSSQVAPPPDELQSPFLDPDGLHECRSELLEDVCFDGIERELSVDDELWEENDGAGMHSSKGKAGAKGGKHHYKGAGGGANKGKSSSRRGGKNSGINWGALDGGWVRAGCGLDLEAACNFVSTREEIINAFVRS